MKIITHEENVCLLRCDRGEEVLETLTTWCVTNNIGAGSIFGIGAAAEVILAYYNLETKTYEDHQFKEDLEIVSLLGNIAILNNKPMIHLHGSFGTSTLAVRGGHVKKLIVSATCEITVQIFKKSIERKPDEATGLYLLS